MRRLWKVLSGNTVAFYPSLSALVSATKALIKFCEEHEGEFKVAPLRIFLSALEHDDKFAAEKAFKGMYFGGINSFADWFPPAKFNNETPEYVQEVFVALTVQWYELMSEMLSR